ncbi:3-isopropylmalate dehydratase small subunit [Sphingomonas sp. HF-S4]|uniref:3-isopropylmalate dehydratase small subunit n=1 Tax=Sphingomonas agrestis TaxID=3080540 RepID=A0ABU3Y820_9SPHN|nr:3-isopropylmalate dehydratase small subunit [Sphingomonas sp. HF-S4]MDV3457560.1 3-isopropylmalate dehydratase small subunit [Sphingomonas sp. HF-S4]
MEPVRQVEGRAYPWGAKNIDTDIIIPAHWLKTTTREGLGKGAFETVRAQPGNIFDDPRYAGSPVLIAGDNFGCGSSREHAAWALADMGIKAVIAPSFSDIFSGNAFKNGIVAVVLPQEAIDRLVEVAKDGDVTVDLETMTVTTRYQDRFPFELDAFRRECLMQGLDEIGLTLSKDTEISNYESGVATARPWIAAGAGNESTFVAGAGRT